jgi:hypothetical protein
VERTFKPTQQTSESSAIFTLSSNLQRLRFIVESSNGFFWLISSLLLLPCVLFPILLVTYIRSEPGDSSTVAAFIYCSISFGIFLTIYNLRRRRRSFLPHYIKHYQKEALVFRDDKLEYILPTKVSYPLLASERLGKASTESWAYSSIERVSIYEPKPAKVTGLDIKVSGRNFVLNHFDDLSQLAATFQSVVPHVTETINQRLLPIWSRVLLGALAVIFGSFFIWFLWIVKSAER